MASTCAIGRFEPRGQLWTNGYEQCLERSGCSLQIWLSGHAKRVWRCSQQCFPLLRKLWAQNRRFFFKDSFEIKKFYKEGKIWSCPARISFWVYTRDDAGVEHIYHRKKDIRTEFNKDDKLHNYTCAQLRLQVGIKIYFQKMKTYFLGIVCILSQSLFFDSHGNCGGPSLRCHEVYFIYIKKGNKQISVACHTMAHWCSADRVHWQSTRRWMNWIIK